MDFHCSRIQKAKKPYRCDSTGALIKPGDWYYYLCGVGEGDFYTARIHISVYPIYEKLNLEHWENWSEGLYFDSLLDTLRRKETVIECYKTGKLKIRPDKNFLRNLGYARKIAKLEGVPEWFVKKFPKKN